LLLLGAAQASAASRFAEVGGNGPSATCPVSDPCGIVDAINLAAMGDDVTLLGGLPPAPYTISALVELVVPSNVTVHGTVGARPVIQTGNANGPGVELKAGSVLRDVVVEYTGANDSAILLSGGGTLERVTGHATGGGTDGGCGTLDGGTPVIRDSVCWRDGPGTANPVGGVTARNGSAVAQTLTLRNVTAISSEENDEAGIFAIKSGTGALTVTATNTIAFSETGSDVAHLAGFTPTAVNLDHSNYDSESDTGGVITNPGTGTANQTTPPVFVDRLGGDFHQQPTSTATIDLGTATGLLSDERDFDGHARSIGAAPDIGADEIRNTTTTAVACVPTSLTVGGASTTCTATVTDTGTTTTTPIGSVSFSSSGAGTFNPTSCSLEDGVSTDHASCQVTLTPSVAATHQITGSFGGDLNHGVSEGADQVTVMSPAGTPVNPTTPPPNAAAAIKKCKKKFRNGKKRKRCIRRAKRRARS
jgi:hypothetical protein